MKYKLRPYQKDMVQVGVNNLLDPHKAPSVLQGATGMGKSLVIAGICRQLNEPTLILQPSKELLVQNHEKMLSYDIDDVTLYSASVNSKDASGDFVMATIRSIYKKPELFQRFKYVIIDECHLINPKNTDGMYNKFFKAIGSPSVIGLTASPYRLDTHWTRNSDGTLTSTAGLKIINRITRNPFFKSIDYKMETDQLIKMGYLSPIKYYKDQVDWNSLVLNTTGADFKTPSVETWSRYRKQRIVDAIRWADRQHKMSLTFCSSIEQSEAIVSTLADEKIEAHLVTGETPPKEREQLVGAYRQGKFKHMVNVGVFTTGFDVPALDCIILGRPTFSLTLYYQMVGRGVRLDPEDPEKVLSVYDMAGVVERLGRIETIKVKTEEGGFRDEVHSEVGRIDGKPMYEFTVTPKEKKEKLSVGS